VDVAFELPELPQPAATNATAAPATAKRDQTFFDPVNLSPPDTDAR
jgi:hypothetical protein